MQKIKIKLKGTLITNKEKQIIFQNYPPKLFQKKKKKIHIKIFN